MDTAQLSLVRTPFDDPDFLFELKHDGFRALAHIWDGNCELVSRKRNAYKSFQELKDNLAKLKVQNAVIDGEIVCLDSEGRSIFDELLFRRGCPIFYAFDLLYLNGRELRQLSLIERKEKLRTLIEKSKLPDVICGKYVEGRGVDSFNEVLEGYLQTKLDNSRVAGAKHLAEMNGIEQERGSDLIKVGVIQYIGGLSAELNIHSLIYIRVFE